nr:hypothetical protein [uncultured Draconibacterium sp.]
MNSDIIKIKPEWEHIYKKHDSKVNEIQQVVNNLIENGLKVTFGDIQNLVNNGTALYEQAEQAAKSNASVFSLPAAKRKFIEENTLILNDRISEAKKELIKILALEGVNTLSIEAFELTKGIVSISETWIEALKESHTIRTSERRERALELMSNFEVAANELNEFVKENKYFGAGISTASDTRRCLMWIGERGEINRDIDNLEFIN